MLESGIYKIENQVNGRFYIGSAIKIKKRWQYHVQDLSKRRHKNTHLQNAWNQYGSENFKFEVLEYCNPADLINREQYYFDSTGVCENGYNICQVAGNTLGYRLSQEAKNKISKINKGCKGFWTGKHFSEEHRANISKAHKGINVGEKHHFYGKHHSEETKRKLREVNLGNKNKLGKHHSEESCKKMSESHKGVKLSEEHRRALSIGQTGKKKPPFSEEHRRKLSNSHKGIIPTAETRAKMSIAQQNRFKNKEN